MYTYRTMKLKQATRSNSLIKRDNYTCKNLNFFTFQENIILIQGKLQR